MSLSPNLQGAVYMTVAMAGFTVNDAITKFVSEEMNPAQIMLVRGLFACVFVGLLAWRRGALADLRLALQPMVGLRVAAEVFATVTFLAALAHLPIANVSAVLQALPLAVTMGAALVFGEGVGWRRWLAIAAGFAGVLVIVRPGFEGFSLYSLLALASVFFCAVRDLATKRIPQHVPTLLVSTMTTLVIMLTGGLLLQPFGGWTPMSGQSFGLLALASVLLLIGYQAIITAMRMGEISFIAPFRYTSLLSSIMLGLVIFGDVPDLAMIVGALVIVMSGLYTLYRERVVGPRRPAAESTGPAMEPDGI
ncbi:MULTISPECIES: DMT family transporter [unclassified Mesorhizobium]|uniref:DMT family transporter n=1 Tax=unclassified Mesorhizobium TaxID=325217 RepID=UPI0006F2014D|nr:MULTISPECIES: DMT family transporter [unclassified Mesorhizobium]KQZ13400.1 hypothetical protein ASD27_04400 [Mesorhizobium sp. Root1471]KQZ35913.1 hypothetical protein ASD44_04395 [Mesorhizobium sp. Root554]MDR7032241.1 drug/metabolite transporter (DMT)-like permease [Mesorhizobium sp. BE184]